MEGRPLIIATEDPKRVALEPQALARCIIAEQAS